MTREDEELVKAMRDGTETCAECQYYGEPCGCNRPEGECDGWDIGQSSATAIERLSAENAELREALQNWHEPHPDELPKPPEEGGKK